MLRSVGVPTRIVLGYPRVQEDERRRHPRSLAVPRPQWGRGGHLPPPSKPGEPPWRWLTLDPTPGAEDENQGESGWGQWWQSTRQGVSTFFKNLIVEYDADQQERTRNAVSRSGWWSLPQQVGRLALGADGRDWPRAVLLALVGLATVFVARTAVRRRRAADTRVTDPAITTYNRMLGLLRSKLAMVPGRAQTPREFAAAAGERLKGVSQTMAFSDFPDAAVVLYYRVRFGCQPAAGGEVEQLDSRMIQLAKVLGAAG